MAFLSPVSSHNAEEHSPRQTDRLTVVAVAETIRTTPGLGRLLAKNSSISLISCPANATEVTAVCRQLKPCVLIAEMSFIQTLNLVVLSGNHAPEGSIQLLAVVDQDDPELCKRLLKMGCSGAVQRTAPPSVYRRALRAVRSGELWASRGTISVLVRELLLADQPRRLTEREKEILALIANGHHNRQIADLLFISRETVRWHVRTMYKKLGIRDRDHAIAFANAATGFAPVKPPQKAAVSSKLLKIPSAQE